MMELPCVQVDGQDPPFRSPPGCALAQGLVVALGGPLRNSPPAPHLPTNSELRQVQLATFGCARENTAAECSRAQGSGRSADGSNRPLLSSFCKDSVWDVLSKSPDRALKTASNAVMPSTKAGETGYSAVVRRASDPKPAAAKLLRGRGRKRLGSGGDRGRSQSAVRN